MNAAKMTTDGVDKRKAMANANDPKADFLGQGQIADSPKPDSIFSDAPFDSRQWRMNQAVASAMIEGYVPHPDFLEDGRLLCQGLITGEEMQERIKRRAMGTRL